MHRRLLIATLLLCSPLATPAQTPPPTAARLSAGDIPLLQGDILIDGKLDDAGWAGALVQEIEYEIDPGENTPAPAKTTVRIGYTADALYVAFHARDPDPARIRAHLRDRDSAFNDDWVGVFLDTFNDNRRGYELVVNPLGVQADLIRDETNSDNQEDPSWDGLWTSAGRITADGYEVEIRIPFSTLRFPAGGDKQRWGIMLFRSWPRDQRHQLASAPMPRDANCFQCHWPEYDGIAGVRRGHNLEVVPTLTVGASQSRSAAGMPWGGRQTSFEPGLDVSWSPSPALTLNATLNPDFSQVETDQLQLSINDSFALFYQEKRPFFLEGADYFNGPFNVLHTRQIADPDVGLRITGRTGSGAYGALVARDATTVLLVPGVQGSGFRQLDQKANVAVGRYRHDLSPNLSVGVIGTFRSGEDYANHVVGIDTRWQQGAHTFSAQVLHSQSRYPAAIVAGYAGELGSDPSPSGNAWQVNYRFSNRNWSAVLAHVAIDPGFRADLGFIGQVGYDKTTLGGGHTWYLDGQSIYRIQLSSDWDLTHRYDGQLLEREIEVELEASGPKQSHFGISSMARVRYWQGTLFHEHNLNLYGNFRPTGNLQLGTYLNIGRFIDLQAARTGHRTLLGTFGNASIGRGLALEWDFSRQRLWRDGGTAFSASVLNAGGSWQFDPRQRLRLTLQGSHVRRSQALYLAPVNQVARDWAAQLVYSYKIDPRTALYAGASYGAFMDDDHPELFGDTRSVFLKLSYGWQP